MVRVRQGGRSLARTFETYEQTREWRDITVGQVTGRTYVDRAREQRTTLAEVLARYRLEVTPSKMGARQEAARLLTWERQPFAALPLVSVEPSHVVAWRTARLAETRRPRRFRTR